MKFKGSITYFLPNDLPLLVTYEGHDDPGQLSGPPENCYPPDSEMNVLSTTLNGEPYEPTEEQLQLIEEACWEDTHEN